MRELLKSMREATIKSGMLDNAAGDMGTDLLDQQFAVQMSGQPSGLADQIALQLSRQMGVALPSTAATQKPVLRRATVPSRSIPFHCMAGAAYAHVQPDRVCAKNTLR